MCTLQGPFLAIFATELGERNANIKKLLKKNSLCGFTVPLFQVFKNWLKCVSALTAYVTYVWGAAPWSALPTADENAVTESIVTTVSSSLFQSATVYVIYCIMYSMPRSVLFFISVSYRRNMAPRVFKGQF